MKLLVTGTGFKKIALAFLGVGLLLMLACGTRAAPAEPSARSYGNLPEAKQAAAVAPSEVATVGAKSIPVSTTIGNNVGERIPDFAITLIDGSTVTSADLLAERQPTFLFFFETW
jgi:hypothetical protein